MPENFTVDEEPAGRILVVRGDWTPDAERTVSSGGVDGLRLNYALGFRERSLDFIREWPLRSIEILARTIKDVRPVYRLSNSLERLSLIVAPQPRVDLAMFPRLRALSAEWEQVADTIAAAPYLMRVFFTGYDQPDLQALGVLPALQSLRMKEIGPLHSLAGVDVLPQLTELEIVGAPLGDIDALRWSPQIEDLWLEGSLQAIDTLDRFSRLTALRFLEIGNCGPFKSLTPLRDHPRLEEIWAWGMTDIRDGDLTPLTTMPMLHRLRMRDRKHYRPQVAELLAQGLSE